MLALYRSSASCHGNLVALSPVPCKDRHWKRGQARKQMPLGFKSFSTIE